MTTPENLMKVGTPSSQIGQRLNGQIGKIRIENAEIPEVAQTIFALYMSKLSQFSEINARNVVEGILERKWIHTIPIFLENFRR